MIAFIDTEVNIKSKRIVDIGCVKENGEKFHSDSFSQLNLFIRKVDFLVGHNIINHDIIYLRKTEVSKHINPAMCIDTLFLSTLLFPERPYHALVKDDKLETDSINNPLIDAQHSQKLFYDEIIAFQKLDIDMQDILYTLLKDIDGFSAFFKHIHFQRKVRNIEELIRNTFEGKICSNVNLTTFIRNYPRELAFALSLIRTNDVSSLLPPWVLKNYSNIESLLTKLRNIPCPQGCKYCDSFLNPYIGLKKFFDYDGFRDFEGVPLQERAVKAALRNESLIAVFPTGGGKSLTFQLPALMSRENNRGLTVVISPLQSLMKDQVDNLEAKGITYSETISGLLDPIQRSKAIQRVATGDVSILYIAPESLRSKNIEKLILGRPVGRFVIDEAHCFSSWGHDFRVDYLYIGEFIKNIQKKKNLSNPIPVSCFTATAKKNVIKDIQDYFKAKLDIEMNVYEASSQRKNLKYKVYEVTNKDRKYDLLRNLIDQENCPTIIYSARRKTVEELHSRLKLDGYNASFFHGGMEVEDKVEQQNRFMNGKSQIMVATSAFGMGVDKADVGCVIHFDISDSLENYVQESGRAGRDAKIEANCYILYHDDDLNKHFEMLNRSKLNLKEIQQIWRAIKEATKLRDSVSQSALEIARIAGWDDTIVDIQTRVTTAISALEESGYLKRGLNSPRIFADSILSKSVIDANKQIDDSELFIEDDKVIAKRIIKKLISSKYKSKDNEEYAESRIDYISDDLGIPKTDVIKIVNLLREISVLSDDQDLSAFLKSNSKVSSAPKLFSSFIALTRFVISRLSINPELFNIKALNEEAMENQIQSSVKELKVVINYLEITKIIEIDRMSLDTLYIRLTYDQVDVIEKIDKLVRISEVILEYLSHKPTSESSDKSDNLIRFSIIELKEYYEKQKSLLDTSCTTKDIEDSLYFLQKTGSIHIEGGFLVVYSPMSIERIVKDNHKQYTKVDYQKLEDFYTSKMQQIHIVGEYAHKMIEDYKTALQFVDDYFQFEYPDFLNKYFVGRRKKDIQLNMTPKRFQQLFGSLSEDQLKVIIDKDHKRISVAAGPGSGKTKLLVHKLASIIYTEDIRQEQLLMLTFSRAAVTEFKLKLQTLIGSAAPYIEITTFHSFCFDILGRVGVLEKSDNIVKEAIEMIRSGQVDPIRITKMVLVIDEAQDMSEDEFTLVKELINYNDNLRVIAVGDDDQNIFEFRGSSSQYFRELSLED
ncbi:MAG: RecQ family ATP-dependent DNA helicase, partial [Candidatus Izemoplasmatales bacterium]|nr:RecQ family ATP-dependent DNA helicase [Candidatus Izemoplasmatales bacterium]